MNSGVGLVLKIYTHTYIHRCTPTTFSSSVKQVKATTLCQ